MTGSSLFTTTAPLFTLPTISFTLNGKNNVWYQYCDSGSPSDMPCALAERVITVFVPV